MGIFANVMASGVLATSVDTANASLVRAYSHCAVGGGLAGLFVNLDTSSVNATLTGVMNLGKSRTRYTLEGSATPGLTTGTGIFGTNVELNGELLALETDGKLPSLDGKEEKMDLL